MSQLRTLVVSYKWLSLFAGMIILLGMGAPATAWSQQMSEQAAAPNPVGTVFTYQGRLSTNSGPATGAYDFQFTLYDAETDGNVIGATQTQSNINVNAGVFAVQLDFGAGAFPGAPRWLSIAVRPAGNGEFEALTPRQPLTPVPYAIFADNVNLNVAQARVAGTCPENSSIRVINGDGTVTCEADDVGGGNNHDHLGQTWVTNENFLTIQGTLNGNSSAPLVLSNTGTGHGLIVTSEGTLGNAGIVVQSNLNNGVNAVVKNANAFNAQSTGTYATIYAENNGTGNGIGVVVQNNNAVTAFNKSNFSTIYGENSGAGTGGWFTSFSGDNILVAQEEVSEDSFNTRFRVALNGQVYADGSFNPGGADFAEMLPAIPGLTPGDVLVIGSEGILIRSSVPNAATIAGVYSTKPGFVGGLNAEDDETSTANSKYGTNSSFMGSRLGDEPTTNVLPTNPDEQAEKVVSSKTTPSDPFALIYTQQGKIPLAVIGVVPVKVTAENGPIQPGDLLTTSSTPGHAMKASPVNLSGIELYRPGTILGKALEPWTEGAGVIQLLLVLQ